MVAFVAWYALATVLRPLSCAARAALAVTCMSWLRASRMVCFSAGVNASLACAMFVSPSCARSAHMYSRRYSVMLSSSFLLWDPGGSECCWHACCVFPLPNSFGFVFGFLRAADPPAGFC